MRDVVAIDNGVYASHTARYVIRENKYMKNYFRKIFMSEPEPNCSCRLVVFACIIKTILLNFILLRLETLSQSSCQPMLCRK